MDDFDRLMEIQRFTASRIRQEAEVDNKIKVLEIISDLADKRGRVQIEAIIIEAYAQGLSESEVLSIIDSIKKDGVLKEVEQGFVQLS